ncbi:conserved oligomeric Golgi complex subunit 8 [Physcomitrium patens]|uniref:Conserved oligomeric Golgi complex subunit 8 n=3 Tax=Physcomitrium patens TaxID=3218 RepID=A0A2K1L1I0_PHYPA|nr:conserved oligomeric Golgi complex subunit 8-like [Physcomitrium patens]PNR59886.1 hypothetical protein PHYPA_002678 [Physcomitrium patens]|eukprot:XP_024398186.1 conserved oligomeric Golgi complex subunit 8-like [Physcomitrella patens]
MADVMQPFDVGLHDANVAGPLPLQISNATQQAYISELLSFNLERLHKEPELLRVDGDRIRRQMQEVAVGHYRAFITAADAVQNITHEITSVDGHLKTLIAEIPNLIIGCNDFMDDAQKILEKRQLNRTLLANHSSLLDLLEIPQLMDTCVRNGNYDEALDLEAFVTKLATMHSRLPVIQSLDADVRQTTQTLLAQILQRLRSNIPLPECLRVIGYLRRLAVFNEHEIRLQFLRCREAWLVGIIDDLDQSNPYEYLKRMADCHRVHLFDVVMQYRAIFSDDTSGHEENTDGGLLYSWAMHRISSHLNVLRDVLPQINEGPNLAIILDQCMYCGMSLGRVGLDFRGLLPPLFESSVHNLFVRNMSVTVDNFQHVLDSHRWVPLPRVTLGRASSLDHSPDDVAPPYSIMEHPPLAAFVNGVLAALNELRHCAPINLKATLALELQCALQSVSNSLLRYNATRIVKASEKTLFLTMCRAFIEVVCPYCTLCFGKCYSGGSVLIQTNIVLEGVRKLVSTYSYSKDIRNENQMGSFDLDSLRQNLPSSGSSGEAANGGIQHANANGNDNHIDNGHVGTVLEDGVVAHKSAVDEAAEEQISDSNCPTDVQVLEP